MRPLKLKSERAQHKDVVTPSTKYLSIVVDTGVVHLTDAYTYAVPAVASISVGHIVEVPFNNRTTTGFVVGESEPVTNPKFITKSLSGGPVFTQAQLHLFRLTSQRYGCGLYDVMRLALPHAAKSAQDTSLELIKEKDKELKRKPIFRPRAITVPIGENRYETVLEFVQSLSHKKLLLIVPNVRDLMPFIAAGFQPISGLSSKSMTAQAYIKANFSTGIFVGLRSSIFLDLEPDDGLIILDDLDPAHYEKHQPTYNTRDVALLRSKYIQIYFIATFHSAEIAKMIQSGWIEERLLKSKKEFQLLSENTKKPLQQLMKDSLKTGSVLLPAVSKSYRLGISCNKCRTQAHCKCGGRIIEQRRGSYHCNVCDKRMDSWVCEACGSNQIRTISRGGGIVAEELARSIPNFPIFHITSDNMMRDIPDKAVVLSTPGLEPHSSFSLVAVTDAEYLLSLPHLRSDELTILRWLNAISQVQDGGTVYISLPPDSHIFQSINKRNWWIYMNPLLASRKEVLMPPFSRIITVRGPENALSRITKILGSSHQYFHRQGQIIVKSDVKESEEVAHGLSSANRIFSLKRQETVRVEIDPFEVN